MLRKKTKEPRQSNNGQFDRLPVEIILNILNYLENPQELARLSEVSMLFYCLSSHNDFWKKFINLNPQNQIDGSAKYENGAMKKIFIHSPDSILSYDRKLCTELN